MALQLQIVGNAMQMAVVQLQPGQTVYCEAGKFLFKTVNVSMDTRISSPNGNQQGGGGGGMGGMLRQAMGTAMQAGQRMLAGESIAFQYFTAQGSEGTLGFAGTLPGEMRALEISPGQAWLAEKDAFVAAESGVNFGIAFSGLRSGMAGGEGFILEKFTGQHPLPGLHRRPHRLAQQPAHAAAPAALLVVVGAGYPGVHAHVHGLEQELARLAVDGLPRLELDHGHLHGVADDLELQGHGVSPPETEHYPPLTSLLPLPVPVPR